MGFLVSGRWFGWLVGWLVLRDALSCSWGWRDPKEHLPTFPFLSFPTTRGERLACVLLGWVTLDTLQHNSLRDLIHFVVCGTSNGVCAGLFDCGVVQVASSSFLSVFLSLDRDCCNVGSFFPPNAIFAQHLGYLCDCGFGCKVYTVLAVQRKPHARFSCVRSHPMVSSRIDPSGTITAVVISQ